MEKIIALWGVPRSVSSAFNQMMAHRGDVAAYHEPFGEAYYYGADSHADRKAADTRPGVTYRGVWDGMRRQAETRIVFFKDFPFQLEPLLTDEFLDCMTHSFLIRDPAKTIESNFDKWPDISVKELGFESQHALFDRLTQKLGAPPPVIDAEELLDDTPGVLEAWCDAVGLPFIAEAIEWGEKDLGQVSWFEGGKFHDNLRKSTGLKRQHRSYAPVASHPRMVELYLECIPHYQALYPHRLKAAKSRAA